MSDTTSQQTLLEDLDTRQDQVLEALDELNLQIERLLRECQNVAGEMPATDTR